MKTTIYRKLLKIGASLAVTLPKETTGNKGPGDYILITIDTDNNPLVNDTTRIE